MGFIERKSFFSLYEMTGVTHCVFPQVVPVDSRGETLLAALHSPPGATWSEGRGNLTSFEEEDDSTCVHSSTEDLRRKVSVIKWQVVLHQRFLNYGPRTSSGLWSNACWSAAPPPQINKITVYLMKCLCLAMQNTAIPRRLCKLQ